MRKVVRNDIMSFIAVLVLCLGAGMLVNTSQFQARSKVALSRTKKSYDMTGLWDKIKLKNVLSGARIKWKSSDSHIVRIGEHIVSGVWYQVCRAGKARITATYKGKKYVCRITVKEGVPDEAGGDEPAGEDVSSEESTGDSAGLPGASAESEDTSIPANSETLIYNEKIADFQSRYITERMSDYDKMIAICEYLSKEYDYTPFQSNFETMIVTGGGDCMASRIGVYKLARMIGLWAFKCSRYEDHGRTMVRCGDHVYMTITGFDVPQPRYYMVYEVTEEGLQAMKEKYNNCLSYLGFE